MDQANCSGNGLSELNKIEVVEKSESTYRASCGDAAHPGTKVGAEVVEGRGVSHVVDLVS
jgi:hypothetical protein